MADSSDEASGRPETEARSADSSSDSGDGPIPEPTHDPLPETAPESPPEARLSPAPADPPHPADQGSPADPSRPADPGNPTGPGSSGSPTGPADPPSIPNPGRNPWWKTNEFMVAVVAGLVVTVAGGVVNLVTDSLKGDAGGSSSGSPKPVGRSPVALPPATGDALKVLKVTHVPRQNDHTWMTAETVTPAALAQLNGSVAKASPKGPVADEADPTMRAAGAVESTMSTVELELEGNRPQTVRILGIRAVAQCRAPLNGTLFYDPPQGVADTVKLGFDLDGPSPIAQYVQNVPPESSATFPRFTGDYFADHKYDLNQGDEVTFRLSARTFKGYCEYRYRFDLIIGGTTSSQVIGDGGEPFTVTAPISPTPSEGFRVNCRAYHRIYVGNNRMPYPDLAKPPPPWDDPAGSSAPVVDCADRP